MHYLPVCHKESAGCFLPGGAVHLIPCNPGSPPRRWKVRDGNGNFVLWWHHSWIIYHCQHSTKLPGPGPVAALLHSEPAALFWTCNKSELSVGNFHISFPLCWQMVIFSVYCVEMMIVTSQRLSSRCSALLTTHTSFCPAALLPHPGTSKYQTRVFTFSPHIRSPLPPNPEI